MRYAKTLYFLYKLKLIISSNLCFCENTYDEYAAHPSFHCSTKCKGETGTDVVDYCGDENHLSVYTKVMASVRQESKI
jgi:hypothetical protein